VLASGNFDAIITNSSGCGSTLKEYDELLDHDDAYRDKAKKFRSIMRDVNEFLASIELNPAMGSIDATVTYQDSCHLAHGQKIRKAPRQLLAAVPGLKLREMPLSDICCGSAGIYSAVHTNLSMNILEKKMANVNLAKPDIIATANPGCMLQLQAGVRKWGRGTERVMHVVEILDEAYRSRQ
jgi:glycolate oxidase iron-sulfur subunit